jgi:hypothetical protein
MEFGQLFTAFIGFAIAWILAYPTYNWFWGQKKVSLYKSIIESYRYEVDILNNHYEKLRLEKAEQDQEFYDLQTQNASLSTSLQKRQTLLIEHEDKLKKFSSQNGEIEGKAEGLRQEVFRKTEQLDVLHRQLQQKTAQLQQYEQELEHQKSLVAQLQLRSSDAANNPVLLEKNKQIANLHTQLSTLLPLEAKFLTQTNEINELRVQRQHLQEFLHTKDENIAELKVNCKNCTEKVLQLNEEVEQIGALITENANIRNENDRYAEQLKILETHLEELKKQPKRIEPTMVESVQSAKNGENDLTEQTIDTNDMARKKSIKQEIITEKEETNLPKTEIKSKKTSKVSDEKTSTKIESVSSDTLIAKDSTAKTEKKSAKIDDYEIEETESKPKKEVETAKVKTKKEVKPKTEILAEKETEEVKIAVEKEEEIDEEAKKRETPIFKALAEPKLPELDKENRLFLQMQSPTRIFFYWSVKTNAYKTLQKAFGENAGGYMLVAKLQNLSSKNEDIFPIDVEGSAWFDVSDNTNFQTEVGFFAPNRPFVRVAFSNTLQTPRMSPSPNVDNSPHWNVSTMQFAEVLEASGYSQDAFEVAMQGEQSEDSNKATEVIYSRITGENEEYFAKFDMSELRSVLLGIVSGIPLAVILEKVSGELSAWLSENPQVFEPHNVMAILQETFGEDFGKFVEGTKTQTAGVVFGASSINFPKSRFAGSSR